MKESGVELLNRFSAKRFKKVVDGLTEPQKAIVQESGLGILLDVSSYSVPDGLLQWIIERITPELCEFRNNRNGTSILFTKEMVQKVTGLPSGSRPVIVLGSHEESEFRDVYKREYATTKRAPIADAIEMLKIDMDKETFLRTFFLIALSTYLCPGTNNMLRLGYLGSLNDVDNICQYDWCAHILKHVMEEVAKFQKKQTSGLAKVNIGGFIDLLAIIYMDHLDFPPSILSDHRFDYSLPRASHVKDEDFVFVMKQDRNKLSLKPHSYGARPFRPFHMTPYFDRPSTDDIRDKAMGDQRSRPSSSQAPWIPGYLLHIIEKHNALWDADLVRNHAIMRTMHAKRMEEFAMEVIAASKLHEVRGEATHNTAVPCEIGTASPSPGVSAGADSEPQDVADGGSSGKNEDEFWESVSKAAEEVEQARAKEDENVSKAAEEVEQARAKEDENVSKAAEEVEPSEAPLRDIPTRATRSRTLLESADLGRVVSELDRSIGTLSLDKKNRKKRAFIGIDDDVINKKLKVNKEVDDIYKTYILKKCVNPPKKGEEQPHFIVFKDYHISYQNFRESLKPRSRISTEVMELYIRHFNLVANKSISNQPTCKKFAFSQSITSKLMVDDRTFDPNTCKGEFMRLYEEFKLEKFDLLYFAIVHGDHWILCCINLLYKTSNVFNSLKRSSLDDIYEAADNVVVNFFALARATNTFSRYKRGEFKSDYPQDCPQQRTIYDCGIFTMLFMEKWDGKALKKFDPDHIIDFRKVIAEGLIRSPLNTQDSSWVLTWKK